MIDNIGKFIIHNSKIEEAVSFSDIKSEEMDSKLIYEVIRVIDGVPLFMQDHFDRLKSSFESVNKVLMLSMDDFSHAVYDLISTNKNHNCNVMLEILADDVQEWDLYVRKSHYPASKTYEIGIKVGTIELERENPEAKVWNSDYKSKVDLKMKENNYYEVLLVNHDGFITEGSRSNVFFVKGNKVYTSPLKYVLTGITSVYAVKCCENEGIEVVNELISNTEISTLDAAFITGTSVNILPIASINNIVLGSTQNHIIKRIMKSFGILIREIISSGE